MKSPHLLLTVVLFFLLACGVMSLPAKSDVLPSPQPGVESHQNAQEAPGTKFDGILTRSTPETVFCVSAVQSLNLRVTPSTSAEGLDVLYHGDRVERIGAAPGWYKIVTADGRRGWVRSSYVEVCE